MSFFLFRHFRHEVEGRRKKNKIIEKKKKTNISFPTYLSHILRYLSPFTFPFRIHTFSRYS